MKSPLRGHLARSALLSVLLALPACKGVCRSNGVQIPDGLSLATSTVDTGLPPLSALNESSVTLMANPDTPFQHIVGAIDALRGPGGGANLFPEVYFAVPNDLPMLESPAVPPLSSSAGVMPELADAGALDASETVKVTGGEVANASQVLARMRAGFRQCFAKALALDAKQEGTVRVTARIGPNGEVQSVSATKAGNLDESAVACIKARVQSAQFEPPKGGEATLVFPVTFVRQQ